MSNLKIKVCGMRDIKNILSLAELKPDLMGFVFYPASPRFAGETSWQDLFSSFPTGIVKTGVFVNASLDNIKAMILRFGLNAVQLHGDESPEICKKLRSLGVKVIKAFRIDENTDFSKMKDYVSCSNWFLFDKATELHGGSGESFNWKLLEKYNLLHPFFLSGGIDLEDAVQILSINHPSLDGVDINSKFEIEPGVKDIEKVRKFMEKIRSS